MRRKISLLGFGLVILIVVLVPFRAISFPEQTATSSSTLQDKEVEVREASSIWNYTYGWADEDLGAAIIAVSSGGYAVGGYTNNTGAGEEDAWLVRLDTNGNLLWNYTYGGSDQDEAYSLVECNSGGFAMAGFTYSYDEAPWPTPGYGDAWLVRVDASGGLLWHESFGTGSADTALAVVECINGDFALAGHTASYGKGNELWLIRTDSSGNHLWNQTYGGDQTEKAYWGHILCECSDGGFAITGYTVSYGLLGGGDFYLVRTDSTGNIQWNSTFGGTDIDRARSVIECDDGGFLMAGAARSFVAGESDMWLVRVDANGDHMWNRSLGGVEGAGGDQALLLSDGSFVIAGANRNLGAGQDDMWLVSVDANGDELWNYTFGFGGNEWAKALVSVDSDDYVLCGYTDSQGAGQKDLWVLQVHIEPPPTTTPPPPPIPGFPWLATIPTLIASLGAGLALRRAANRKRRFSRVEE